MIGYVYGLHEYNVVNSKIINILDSVIISNKYVLCTTFSLKNQRISELSIYMIGGKISASIY